MATNFDRRYFLKKLPALGAMPFLINGIPISTLAQNLELQALASASDNDKVLIILQLHGGNDGLNMLVPMTDYDKYVNARPNIALPDRGSRRVIQLDSTLADNAKVGLHPNMTGVKDLYDNGKVCIVQGVSYSNHNQSHFRGRDILFMGGGSNDYLDSGWAGRYLQKLYAPKIYPNDFPVAGEMEDPLALEFGNEISSVFYQGNRIPMSISINDPISFFNLVNDGKGFEDKEPLVDPRGIPPAGLSATNYFKELNWILELESKTDRYDNRLKATYDAGNAQSNGGVVYPVISEYPAPQKVRKNPLSAQLQIIAKLLHGGSKTKIFLIRMGGFDTHAGQTENYDPTIGTHAALLNHISTAMYAFQNDLKGRGLEDRVMTITASEFGRRIYANDSFGTDHGLACPVMIFGKHVKPGVIGTNTNFANDNVEMQYDYRQVYGSIMKDWFEVDETDLGVDGIFKWGSETPLSNIQVVVGLNDTKPQFYKISSVYPNPAKNSTVVSFRLNASTNGSIKITNTEGKSVKNIPLFGLAFGENQVEIDLSDVAPGNYIMSIKAGQLEESKHLQVLK